MSAPCKDTQRMSGTNLSLEGEQAGRQCDSSFNCRMLQTQRSPWASHRLPNLNSRNCVTVYTIFELLLRK
jgi:hypothetical protein